MALLGMGWRGSARHWKNYEALYILLAGIATPLVLSVHTVVSFDFAVAIMPGWHTTIFPPYFVAGAIYSGFAMVLVLAIPIRKYYHLEGMITMRHLQNSAKIMLATGLIVAYGYAFEAFIAFYSGSTYERFMMENRWFGQYSFFYWMLILCNILIPQVLWFPKVRAKTGWLFCISLVVLVGMWLERFVIIVTSLQSRLPALVLGPLHPHALGLCRPGGHDRLLRDGDVYLHSHHAVHLDFRNADSAA